MSRQIARRRELRRARGEGTKVVVALRLNQDSILIASWRNQIRIHLSWSPIAGSGGQETYPIEFYICGIVGRHLIRAHVYVRP